VEECDDLYLKIALREYARKKRVPVLMETSDRGLLEIERFDLEPERGILHGLMEAGCVALAPSAGNSQPWKFRFGNEMLRVCVDPVLRRSMLHYGEPATLVAFGASLENLRVGARALGLRMTVDAPLLTGPGDFVFSAAFARGERRDPSGLRALTERVTNRRRGERAPLRPEQREALERAAREAGGEIVLVTERSALDAFADLTEQPQVSPRRFRLIRSSTSPTPRASLSR
jgi:nitroreductase